MKAKDINKAINWGLGFSAAYFIGTAIAGAIKKHRESGVGKVERIKRRIYKEVSLAQSAGVDFSKKYAELSKAELDALEHIGKDVVMWKQSKRSIESGKPYTESYYGSLRRAWNAVSGIQGIGATDYPVYDRDGNVCLTWTDVTEHIEHEPEAKTLLALPPHIEEKKPKTKRAPKAPKVDYNEFAERQLFAEEFLSDFAEKEGDYIKNYLNQLNNNGTPLSIVIADEFAHGTLKIKENKKLIGRYTIYIDGAWRDIGILETIVVPLFEAWETRGLRSDNINDIRRKLLERAKFMAVSDDGSAFGNPIQGEERYNYLDKINWIVVVRDYYDNGEKTTYPYRAFETKEWAEMFAKSLRSWRTKQTDGGTKRLFDVMPITELDFEKITGIL